MTSEYSVKIARTLFDNVYRARLTDENGQPIGELQVIPVLTVPREQLPEDAPEAYPYLLVIVRDANINKDNLLDFEERTDLALRKRFATPDMEFQHSEFYYPSPAFFFDQPDALKTSAN